MAWTDQDEQEYQSLKSQFDTVKQKFTSQSDRQKNPDLYGEQGLIEEVPGVSAALSEGTTPLAEAIGETTQIPEAIRSPLSGAIGIAPEIAAAMSAPGMAKMLAPGVTAGTKMVGKGAKALGNLTKRTITGPATESLPGLENEIANMPLRKIDQMRALTNTGKKWGSEIETTRKGLGLPQQMTELPEIGKGADAAAYMQNITQLPIEELARLGPKKLLALRDAGQMAQASTSEAESAVIGKGMSNIYNALEKVGGEAGNVGSAYKGYGLAKKQVESFPKDYQRELISMKNNLRNVEATSDKEKFIRKIGWVGAGLAGGAVMGKNALLTALGRLGGGQ